MIKYFHELRKEEHEWLIKEGITLDEIEKDFPQPPWCSYPHAIVRFGCWSLTDFSSGYSAVTGEDFCRGCDCYKPVLSRCLYGRNT